MIDYLAIGHVAQDVAPGGYRLGGTVAYSALTAKALGLQVGIVTAAADGAVMDGLELIPVHRIPSPKSTVYENVYHPEGRVQTLHSQAAPLGELSIPADWRNAGIVHLGPIANEIDADLVDYFPNSFVGLTPQGWMRVWDDAGRVSLGQWGGAARLLAKASAAVISIEDVKGDWALAELWAAMARVFVVTEGELGATVFANGQRQQFAAPKVEVVDATGAGDVFAASFFVRLWQTGNPQVACKFAIAVASDSITRIGIEGVPQQHNLSKYG